MFTALLSRLTTDAAAALAAFGHQILALLDGVDEARAVARRYAALTRMSDRELASHGLKREDIARAAFAGSWS